MTIVTIEQAKSRMEELAHLAAGGEEVRIAIANDVLLELRSVPGQRIGEGNRVGGQWAGLFEVGPEFFEPMPEDWLADFYEGSVFPSEEPYSKEGACIKPE